MCRLFINQNKGGGLGFKSKNIFFRRKEMALAFPYFPTLPIREMGIRHCKIERVGKRDLCNDGGCID